MVGVSEEMLVRIWADIEDQEAQELDKLRCKEKHKKVHCEIQRSRRGV